MRTFIVTFLFTLFYSYSAYCTNLVKINTAENTYIIGESTCTIVTYELLNTSNTDVWIWLTRDDGFKTQTDSTTIKKFFWGLQEGKDIRLAEVAYDGNVEKYIPKLRDSFVKVLSPGSEFSIHIIFQDCEVDSDKRRALKCFFQNHIVIFAKNRFIKKYAPQQLDAIIYYKGKDIIINSKDLDMLESHLSK